MTPLPMCTGSKAPKGLGLKPVTCVPPQAGHHEQGLPAGVPAGVLRAGAAAGVPHQLLV